MKNYDYVKCFPYGYKFYYLYISANYGFDFITSILHRTDGPAVVTKKRKYHYYILGKEIPELRNAELFGKDCVLKAILLL